MYILSSEGGYGVISNGEIGEGLSGGGRGSGGGTLCCRRRSGLTLRNDLEKGSIRDGFARCSKGAVRHNSYVLLVAGGQYSPVVTVLNKLRRFSECSGDVDMKNSWKVHFTYSERLPSLRLVCTSCHGTSVSSSYVLGCGDRFDVISSRDPLQLVSSGLAYID